MAQRLESSHLYELAFVSDPQLSSDGRKAAAVVTSIAEQPEGPPQYRGRIDLFDVKTGDARRLTNGPVADTSPRFSPDARQLAYLSVREVGTKPQLFVIELDGGEARAVTEHPAGVDLFAWDPSDQSLVYLSRGDAVDAREKSGQPLTVTRARYKQEGIGFLPGTGTTLYRRHLDRDASEPLADFEYAPSEITVDASGALYLIAPSSSDDHDAWRQQIWRLSKTGNRRRALLEEPESVGSVAVSPDGANLAYLAPSIPQDSTSPMGVWVKRVRRGRPMLLTGDLEAAPAVSGDARYGRYPNVPAWQNDGGTLLANLNVEGRSGLASIALDGSITFVHRASQAVTAFQAVKGRVAFIAETPTTPGELWLRFKNGRERQLSSANETFLEGHELATAAGPFLASGDEHAPVRYWTLNPPEPRKDRALVIQVHGGPHTNYGYGFTFEFQVLAAAGYRVVYGNPRGSSSFGHQFSASMHAGYGSIDADDVMAIADHALEHHDDPQAPIHLTGGSYGGFMTNWLVGHSRRFRSAVTQRSISNWLSFYGTSDIGYHFTVEQLGGRPWDDMELLWHQSPIRYVAEVTTPLLIIHSEQDHRCPIEQAEQFYSALKTLDRAETEMIRFPGEGHELSRSGRPDRRVARLDAIRTWFERHP